MEQAEADRLIELPKVPDGNRVTIFRPGTNQTITLTSVDKREIFLLDVWQGTLKLSRVREQVRGHKITVLTRLDIDGAPHTNPDGEKLPGTHLHIYREGYEDKWAYLLNPKVFRNAANLSLLFDDYCSYNHIQGLRLQGQLI